MIDIGGKIRYFALADSAVSSLVNTRMYSDSAPQDAHRSRGTIPAITYRVIDTIPNESLGGVVNIAKARVEVSAISDSRGEANALAGLIRVALHRKHRGENQGDYIHEINLATGEAYSVEREPPAMGSAIRFYITTQDFFVTHRV